MLHRPTHSWQRYTCPQNSEPPSSRIGLGWKTLTAKNGGELFTLGVIVRHSGSGDPLYKNRVHLVTGRKPEIEACHLQALEDQGLVQVSPDEKIQPTPLGIQVWGVGAARSK